jgi:photosystem II stability/assembly factor-like uncharacterized protein
MIRLRWACLLALVAAGCTPPPHWSLPLASLDRVALSVYQTTAGETWVVGGALGSGGGALAMRYDGKRWNRYDVGTDATLWWVTEVGPSRTFAVGERGTVLALPSPTPVPTPTTATLYGVWGSEQGNVWIVGGEPDLSGVILRGSGDGTWSDLTPAGSSGAFFKVWGSSDSDVWICGQGGALLHWDGSTPAPVDSGLGRNVPLFTVAGRDQRDVYAVGGTGNAVVLHYDGSAWMRLGDAILADLPGLNGVAVDSDGTAILVGSGGTKLRGRPGAFVDETAAATRQDLHAASIAAGKIFAVGGNYLSPAPTPRQGVVAHYGGDISSTVN